MESVDVDCRYLDRYSINFLGEDSVISAGNELLLVDFM